MGNAFTMALLWLYYALSMPLLCFKHTVIARFWHKWPFHLAVMMNWGILPSKPLSMAKQAGNFFLTGTRENLTFYKMDGQHYVRLKSSLSSKRVKTDPAFALTMVYADMLAVASRTAAQLYRSLPQEQRQVARYRKMTSTAMQLLKAGIPADRLMEALKAAFPVTTPAKDVSAIKVTQLSRAV